MRESYLLYKDYQVNEKYIYQEKIKEVRITEKSGP
jgi:hypothetical protein